jgi:hypothetical protein
MSKSEFSLRAVLRLWATFAGAVSVLGVSAHHAAAQELAKKMSATKTDPREIESVKRL